METNSSDGIVNVVNDQIDRKLESTLNAGAMALESAEVQQMIQAYGLQDYIKNIKQENVRNLLALAGSWYILSKFKKKWPYVIAGFAGLYLYSKSGQPLPSQIPKNTIADSQASDESGENTTVSGYNDSMY